MTDEEALELDLQVKSLRAPRVTPKDIDAKIVAAAYHRFPDTTVTVCCLTLANGFNIVGESACASPENFDAVIGERIAFTNAREKIWGLEGYALRERLAYGTWIKGTVERATDG